MNPRVLPLIVLVACASARPVAETKPVAKLAGPAASPDAFRAQPPAPLPSGHPFVAPAPQDARLASGARLLLIENHALPLVSVEVDIDVGIDEEPLTKRGLSWFLAAGLMEGTTSRSAADIDIAADRLAAQLSTNNGYVTIELHLNALKETLPESLALLSDVLLHPAFKPADMERLRARLLTELAWKKGNLSGMAYDEL